MGEDRRGLDHLMEQNETELGFLSAYGGVDDGSSSDGEAILAALKRFLVAGGVDVQEVSNGVTFAFGSAAVDPQGCRFEAKGTALPLVESDVRGNAFLAHALASDRSTVSVCFTQWTMDQRRFVERLVEHHASS